MGRAATPAFETIRDLRDRLEHRICQSEDYRALVALNRELAAFEDGRHPSAAPPLALQTPADAAPAVPRDPGLPPDLDLDSWARAPRRWWRRRA